MNDLIISYVVSVAAGLTLLLISKWLDRDKW